MDSKKSVLDLVAFSLSMRNSMASLAPMGMRMPPRTHIFDSVPPAVQASCEQTEELLNAEACIFDDAGEGPTLDVARVERDNHPSPWVVWVFVETVAAFRPRQIIALPDQGALDLARRELREPAAYAGLTCTRTLS